MPIAPVSPPKADSRAASGGPEPIEESVMPFYTISHTHPFGTSSHIMELDRPLPLRTLFFDGGKIKETEQATLNSVLHLMGIDFEPGRGETLEIVESTSDAMKQLKVEDLDTGAPEIIAYPDLYNLAEDFDENWDENEGVDWDEAEELVQELKKLSPEHRALLPKLSQIIDYAESTKDWDSGEVASWPATIIFELDVSDKQYSYHRDREQWQIYGMNLTGREEWVATVDTETVARRLTFSL